MIDHIDITATVARGRQEQLRAERSGRVRQRFDIGRRRPRNHRRQ